MRLRFDRHRRSRDQLSAYVDGELEASATERLERHLADCGRCRAELEQLRATIGALQDLPEAELPRSFALSPGRVAAPRPALPAAPPLAFGMRIAAAAVAVTLAVVLVVDIGDIGGDQASQERPARQMAADEDAGAEAGLGYATTPEVPSQRPSGGAATGGGEDESPPAGDTTDEQQYGATPEPGGGGGAELQEPDAQGAQTPAAPADTQAPAAATPAAEPEEAPEAVDATKVADDGGGIGALTTAEIGLAAALGVIVAGSLALAYAGRKR